MAGKITNSLKSCVDRLAATWIEKHATRGEMVLSTGPLEEPVPIPPQRNQNVHANAIDFPLKYPVQFLSGIRGKIHQSRRG